MKTLLSLMFLLLLALPAAAFMEEGCGAGACTDCHSMDKEEASTLLEGWGDEILSVELAEMPGLWRVELKKGDKRYPVYLDFSKSYAVAGNIIRLKDRQNITQERFMELNPVDVGRIPTDEALLLGSPEAKTKAYVFTDPQCPYCKRLHDELHKVVEADPDIAFYIKLFPLQKLHPDAYRISKSIVCNDSMEMLEASLAGKPVPDPTCETDEVNRTIALAAEFGIRSTPTLVMPDGRIMPGSKSAAKILELLGSKASVEAAAQ